MRARDREVLPLVVDLPHEVWVGVNGGLAV